MKFRFFIPLIVIVILAAFFLRGLYMDPTRVPSPLIGKPAPAFTLPTLHDPDRNIGNDWFEGKVSLFNVFGTWCPGCHQEHDVLLALVRSNDVPVLGLNWALGVDAAEEQQAAREWLSDSGNPYAVVAADGDGSVAIDWGIYGAPETFVIDADGIIRYKHIGALTEAVVNDDILPLIAELRAEAGERQ